MQKEESGGAESSASNKSDSSHHRECARNVEWKPSDVQMHHSEVWRSSASFEGHSGHHSGGAKRRGDKSAQIQNHSLVCAEHRNVDEDRRGSSSGYGPVVRGHWMREGCGDFLVQIVYGSR